MCLIGCNCIHRCQILVVFSVFSVCVLVCERQIDRTELL